MKLGNKKIQSTYFKKKKLLIFKGLSKDIVAFLQIVGGDNIQKSTNTSITVDVKKIKDVETALEMISIVTDVKG